MESTKGGRKRRHEGGDAHEDECTESRCPEESQIAKESTATALMLEAARARQILTRRGSFAKVPAIVARLFGLARLLLRRLHVV